MSIRKRIYRLKWLAIRISSVFQTFDISRKTIEHFEEIIVLEWSFSSYLRCNVHTLNLIASIDSKQVQFQNFIWQYITQICSILSSHFQICEIVKKKNEIIFNQPRATRWNDMFSPLSQILTTKEKIPLLYKTFDSYVNLTLSIN